MKIVEVIPITKGLFKENLSYFSTEEPIPGSVVSVPLRTGKTTAIVESVRDATEAKAEIKSKGFALKKIDELRAHAFFLPSFVEAARKTAVYYGGTTGSVLRDFISQVVLKHVDMLKKIEIDTEPRKKMHELLALQAPKRERLLEYKGLIRESFARNESLYLLVPTIERGKELVAALEKGIEDYAFLLHGSLTPKTLLKTWREALEIKHPILIIGTSLFLSIPRVDFGTIILEEEHSRSYRSDRRPYTDTRLFTEYFAKAYGCNLITSDTVLRTETLFRIEEQEILPHRSFQTTFRGAEASVVDMRIDQKGERRPFTVISDELKIFIQQALTENERVFLFTGRRGLSPLTICNDCGTIVACNTCHGPTSLHTGNPQNYFLCHRCGEKRSAKELCKHCGSWKLQTLGIGVEKVADELAKLFPHIPLFRMDKDSVASEKKAKERIAAFLETPGAILLGTELARHYLHSQVGYTALISIDSLFAVPDFRINDRIFSLLLSLRELARRKTLYQTRNIESTLFKYAAEGSINSFFKDEIEGREIFTYPPFSTLIKIGFEGTEREGLKAMQSLEKHLAPYQPTIFPASFGTKKGKVIKNMLLKLARGRWPDDTLRNILSSLPPPFKVEVDPESLL